MAVRSNVGTNDVGDCCCGPNTPCCIDPVPDILTCNLFNNLDCDGVGADIELERDYDYAGPWLVTLGPTPYATWVGTGDIGCGETVTIIFYCYGSDVGGWGMEIVCADETVFTGNSPANSSCDPFSIVFLALNPDHNNCCCNAAGTPQIIATVTIPP